MRHWRAATTAVVQHGVRLVVLEHVARRRGSLRQRDGRRRRRRRETTGGGRGAGGRRDQSGRQRRRLRGAASHQRATVVHTRRCNTRINNKFSDDVVSNNRLYGLSLCRSLCLHRKSALLENVACDLYV